MKFSGNALTLSDRKKYETIAHLIGADECCVGVKKVDVDKYVPVVRFFKSNNCIACINL